MEQDRVRHAIDRIEYQLNNGYLDISEGMMDDDEIEIVREAIIEYKRKHLKGDT